MLLLLTTVFRPPDTVDVPAAAPSKYTVTVFEGAPLYVMTMWCHAPSATDA